VALILGDNIFYGANLPRHLSKLTGHGDGAVIFGYEVSDPERYGVIEFDNKQRPMRIVEKPAIPPSKYAVTGLYFYDSRAYELAKTLRPSARGELEITDLNNLYLQEGTLNVHLLERGTAWLDTGTHEALAAASQYVQTIQARQGIRIADIENILQCITH